MTDDIAPTTGPGRVPLPLLVLVVPVLAALAVLVTDPTWSASAAPKQTSGIRIHDFAFTPATLTVAPGTRVRVLNEDDVAHTMTAPGRFDTSSVSPGHRATITAPSTPGRYRFMCEIHPNMTGTLVVRAP